MPATKLAPYLIGKLLCTNINGTISKSRITETECYFTEKDTACHACKGKTNRTKPLYEAGGIAYVYLCYGIHSLFNIVCGDRDCPQAVLIRGIERFNGPGKLTKALGINLSHNYLNLVTSNIIWIEDDGYKCTFNTTPRIGIDYATEEYKNKLWRYVMIRETKAD